MAPLLFLGMLIERALRSVFPNDHPFSARCHIETLRYDGGLNHFAKNFVCKIDSLLQFADSIQFNPARMDHRQWRPCAQVLWPCWTLVSSHGAWLFRYLSVTSLIRTYLPRLPGVPLKAHVAGVACGAILDGASPTLLLDLKGVEDRRGNMDMKVAGTRQGVTALQLDTKITVDGDVQSVGLDRPTLLRALELVGVTISTPKPACSCGCACALSSF
jgi:hypothetical protein